MWCIEKVKRDANEVRRWELVKEFPTWEYEDEAAVGHAFVIMANSKELDTANYLYRIIWN